MRAVVDRPEKPRDSRRRLLVKGEQMTAWMLFRHAVLMVARNWREALKISGVLYLVLALFDLTVSLTVSKQFTDGGMGEGMENGEIPISMLPVADILSMIVLVAAYTVISLWIAVAWHRYVLLEEMPSGWLPKWHGSAVGRYLMMSLMVMAIVLGAGMCVALSVTITAVFAPPIAVFFGLAGMLFVGALFYRLCPVLPAVAVGESLPLREAWHQTRGLFSSIILLVLLQFMLMLAIQIPVVLIGSLIPFLGLLAQIAASWFLTLVTVSLLTTFYGHFVQERPLAD